MANSANGYWERAHGGFERGLTFLKNCNRSIARGKLWRNQRIHWKLRRDFTKQRPEFPRTNSIFAGLLNGFFYRPEIRWLPRRNCKTRMWLIERFSSLEKYRAAEPPIWCGTGLARMIRAQRVINSNLRAA